tara:strand:+ start:491 stop:685 length:195 start_codon:yes stop_codon:yes gene_type:complete
MNVLKWFSNTKSDEVVVKNLKSKSFLNKLIPITVGDIQRGVAVDETGYENEVVLFLRKNKKDRE